MLGQEVRPVYASDECEIDLGRRELRILGSPVPVGGRAFEVIEVLAQSAGELVTKSELMDRVWPGAVVMENTLHVHTAAVRKALGPYRGLLKTEAGRGYRLLGDWTIRRHDAANPAIGPEPRRPSVEPSPTNLPVVVTPLIGRSAAVQQVRDLLSAYRIVTLTGPGGIGKTTLGLEVARHALAEFSNGGWLVELASLSDPNLVPSTVARALGLKLAGEEISAEVVARSVGERNLLLVLDNCEHIIDAVATLAETFMRYCPHTVILATSREAFRIDGEYVYRLPPLSLPEPGQLAPDQILRHSAVELFVTRSKDIASDFSSRAGDLPAIAAICRHLDGIPLAIEFAAARAATLGVAQVAVSLRDRFALLTNGRRNAVPRHRTLRAALDWSYDLLPESERLLLRRLAIFPASFTIDAVAAVMRESGLDVSAVRESIVSLVAKSLVAVDKSEASTRWYLLETTRTYAMEKLIGHAEAHDAARCHAAYFRNVFVTSAAGSSSRVSIEDLRRHSHEIDNVRAALDWAFSSHGDKIIGVELTAAYAPVLMRLSLTVECCERCERALQSLVPDPGSNVWPQMWLRIALGHALITAMGTSERAHTVLIEALEVADAQDDWDAQARALAALASVHTYRGQYGEARIAVERLRQIADRIGEPALVIVADRLMGTALLTAGRPREAQRYLERVLRPSVVLDGRWHTTRGPTEHRALARATLARALWQQGFADKAHAEAYESLNELHASDPPLSRCRVLYYGVCRITPMTGDFEAANQAVTRVIEIATRLNALFWVTAGRFLEGKLLVERREFAKGLGMLREAFNTCRQTGWRMSYPEFQGALAAALAGLGQLDEAHLALDDAIASAGQRESGQQWYVPELLRIKGEVLLQRGSRRSPSAEGCFDQAGEIAREQGALFWQLRIALSVARLRVTQDRHDDARQILSPVYDRFTEGFWTADLRIARAMLDTLPLA